MKKFSLIIATIIACSAFSALDIQAQNSNRPARRANQQQQSFRGPNQQQAFGGAVSSEQRVKALTETLKLTEEQQTKLKAIFDEQTEAMSKIDSSLSREERREAMQKIQTDSQSKIKEILTAEQFQTYNASRPFMQQPPGMNTLSVDEQVNRLATSLKLTDDQKTKLKELLKTQQEETQKLRGNLQNLSQEQRRTAQQTLRKEQQAKIKELLGDDLYKQYLSESAKMQGPGFGGRMTPEQQVEQISTMVPSISDEQKTKLKAFFEEHQAAMQKQMESAQNLSQEDMRAAMQKNMAERDAKLKEILGDDLYKQYTEKMRNNRPGFGGPNGPAFGGGNPPGRGNANSNNRGNGGPQRRGNR